MSVRAFVDTNILVYAHDRGAGARHSVAAALVENLWEERSGVLSTQVVQEFYVNVRRRAARPLPVAEVRRIIEDYLNWEVVVNDGGSILAALELESRYRLSFRDALIVQAANSSTAEVLYTEDLGDGQVYGSVKAINPFSQETGEGTGGGC